MQLTRRQRIKIEFMYLSVLLGGTILFFATSGAAQTESQKQAPATAPQVQQVLPSYEGQHVLSVELAGRPDIDQQQLAPLLAQHQGEPFAQAKIDQTISALKNSGQAKEIELEIRPQAGGVRVLFILQPAIYFGIYEFPGTVGRFPYSRLLEVSDYPPRGPYTPVDVQDAQASLVKFFQQNGYFEARVEPEIRTDAAHGIVNVIFHVSLNRHAKFGKVIFKGAPPEEEQRLQHALKSWMARVRGSAIRPGKSYSLKKIQNATQYLEAQLISHDYLGSRVQLAGAEYDPATHRADIHFEVTPGPLAHVNVVGAHLWGRTRRKLLPIYQVAGLDPELVRRLGGRVDSSTFEREFYRRQALVASSYDATITAPDPDPTSARDHFPRHQGLEAQGHRGRHSWQSETLR